MKQSSKVFLQISMAFGLILFTLGCSKKNDSNPTVANQYLVSSTLIKEYSKDEVIKLAGTIGGADASTITLFIRSGISQYKIIYNTTNTDGTKIQASGAFILPKEITDTLSLVSIQHGTITDDKAAPSYFDMTGEAAIGSVFASVGFLISMPDYIGYGTSNNLPHTYEQRAGLATASVDMLRAAKEFIKSKGLRWNQNLMIGGYSEGGYANMSLQKKIEEELPTEFNLKASSSGAGAYNKTQTFKNLVSLPSSGLASSNSLYIWVLLTYDRIYKLNRPASAYFIEPYATQIDKDKQNAQISVSLDKTISPIFKTAFINGTDNAFVSALKDNDVYDWKPSTPTQLYHGDADELVGYFNSQTAYDAMKARGSTSVQLIPIKGGTHASSISNYLSGTFQFFASK